MRRTAGVALAGVGLAALGLALLVGCGASGNDSATTSEGAAAPVLPGDAGGKVAPQKPDAASQGQAQGQGQSQAQPTITRAIIKTGSLTIKVDDVAATRQKAITAIAGLDGQVASEDTGGDTDGKITQVNLVLKVPTKSYDAAIDRLSALGDRLEIHQESTDVTEQVVDVASRIESQRASLDRMRALMAKANTVGEVVSVESELTRREADLESLLAKQKNLALQTDLATLTLTVTGKGEPVAAPDPDRGFLAGLKSGWHAFTATFVALGTALGAVLPFLIVLAIIGVPLWRFRHRLRRQRSDAAKVL
ncbi:DUF4349 domain-containing protein [Kribbella sp. NPDC055071]